MGNLITFGDGKPGTPGNKAKKPGKAKAQGSELKAPTKLCAEAQRLWLQIHHDHRIDTAAASALVLQLCECLTDLRQCERQIKEDGLMLRGSKGQRRPHPLLRQVNDLRRLILSTARSLNLDLDIQL